MKNSRLLSVLVTAGSLLLLLPSCSYKEQSIASKKSLSHSHLSFQKNTDSSNLVVDHHSFSSRDRSNDLEAFSNSDYEFERAKSNLLTDTAKILAGMKVSDRSSLNDIENTTIWSNHRWFLNNAWQQLEAQQLSPIRQWQKQELKTINQTLPLVFYPFSNLDFLHAYSLFPQGQEFILMGIEPVGTVTNLASLDAYTLAETLQQTRNYLYNCLPLDYFRPNDLQNLQTSSALPVLYVFLARTNNRIIDVKYVSIDSEGRIKNFSKSMVSGVKITFVTPGTSKPRTLYYFSADLSNTGLELNPELAKFIANFDDAVTYIQSAAYLLHFDSFSQIKNLIIANSHYLLQDDSGLPVNALDPEEWQLKFYGNYTRPDSLFDDKYQAELWQIYNSPQNNIQPLKFGVGYQQESDRANLMLAKNKENHEASSPLKFKFLLFEK